MRNRKAAMAGVAIAVLAAVAGTVSAAAASPPTTPATAGSATLVFSVHFSQFEALHLNPHPDPRTPDMGRRIMQCRGGA